LPIAGLGLAIAYLAEFEAWRPRTGTVDAAVFDGVVGPECSRQVPHVVAQRRGGLFRDEALRVTIEFRINLAHDHLAPVAPLQAKHRTTP
jgi:hypothetical protein